MSVLPCERISVIESGSEGTNKRVNKESPKSVLLSPQVSGISFLLKMQEIALKSQECKRLLESRDISSDTSGKCNGKTRKAFGV
jgi:hypothetical protein